MSYKFTFKLNNDYFRPAHYHDVEVYTEDEAGARQAAMKVGAWFCDCGCPTWVLRDAPVEVDLRARDAYGKSLLESHSYSELAEHNYELDHPRDEEEEEYDRFDWDGDEDWLNDDDKEDEDE